MKENLVAPLLKEANEQFEKKTLAQAKGLDLEKLIFAVAEQLEVDPVLIKSASRQRAVARARSIICCLAVDQLKIRGAEVARKLELSPSSVSKLANRGRKEGNASKIADRIFGCNIWLFSSRP